MNRLRIIRKKKGLTQKSLAQKVDLSIRSYQRYETGERVPNTHLAQKLALFLETTVSELFPLNNSETNKESDGNQIQDKKIQTQ